MSYQFIDESATEVKVIVDTDELLFKKVYCSTAVDGDYLIFNTHEYESNIYRQEFKMLYTDCSSPSAASALALQTAVDAIINNYAGTSTGGGIPHGTASGTDTYTVTISGVTSYSDGDAYLIRFTNGNTTGCTLNINSLGAKTLYRNNDGALIGGDIVNGGEALCVYNSTLNAFQCIGTAPNTLLAYVTNADSVTITKGQPVYTFGGTGDRLTVKRALNTADATSAQTIGVVQSASIGVNQKGLIIMQGQLDNLSIFPTSTWADGDPIYLGATAGSLTKTKPHAPNHLVYLGYVLTASNGNAGRMYVRPQNGYELDEIHDVQAQSPSNKDTLYFDSADSQWKTASIATITGNASASNTGVLSSTDWSTFNNKLTGFGQFRKSGRWYNNGIFPPANAGFVNQIAIRYVPFLIDQDVTITRMGINVVTAVAAGNTCRLGIYTNDATTLQPLNRLVDTGTLAIDSTGAKSVTGLSVSLTKGLYWMAYIGSIGGGSITGIGTNFVFDVRGQASIGAVGFAGYNQTFTYGALPATAGTLTEVNSGGTICIFYYY